MREKREHPRTQIDTHVTCEFEAGERVDGLAKDMSLGGMFVEANLVPAFGAKLSVVCQLPGITKESRLPAVVRWVKPSGFGVQFGLLGARETHALTDLMRVRR